MIGGYDPELPAGFQDADFEMRELEAAAREAEANRRAGRCDHTWHQGYPHGKGTSPGTVYCFHCYCVTPDPYAHMRDRMDGA